MKKQFKLLTLAASAAMMFTACSSDKLEAYSGQTLENPESPSNAISFGTYMGKTGTTRAGVGGEVGHITTTTLQTATQGFGVFAFYNTLSSHEGSAITHNAANAYGVAITEAVTPNFMYNQKVTYETTNSLNKWVYNPVKYWPNDFSTGNVDGHQPTTESNSAQGSVTEGKLSFFAYAPYVEVTASSGTPTSSPDYGIVGLTDYDDTKDPIVSYKFKNTSSSESAMSNDNVDLLWGLQGADNYSIADGTSTTQGGTKATNYNVNLTKEKVGDNVNFLFKHALANFGGRMSAVEGKSGVKVILDVDGNSGDGQGTYFGSGNGYNLGENLNTSLVTIESINIQDVLDGSNKTTLYTEGKFDIANGKWATDAAITKQDGAANAHYVNITYDDELASNVKEPADGTLSYSSGWLVSSSSVTGVNATVQDALTTTLQPSIYMIPGSVDQKFKVTITYYVRTYDANLAACGDAKASTAADAHWTKVKQVISNVVIIPNSLLASNKYVTLVIHLGLTSVKFAASVAEWGDTDGDGTSDANEDKVVWLPSNVVSE